ncbi:MAG: methylated-DNA--[protein]-cysteine S-methyltransferase [Bdellovibrionales bacterium]|nr:methylated-DNA--[protein]-cysteine S-methyltransferase [Bdellovibrionales bacterium]
MNFVFFYSSPIGKLEIHLKKDQIYSLSKAGVRNKVHSKSPLYRGPALVETGIKSDGYRSPFLMKKNLKTSGLLYHLLFFLDNYFSKGEIQTKYFSLFSRGTLFQKKVWKHLTKIPYGQTRSYAEVAWGIGSPGAARAVGSACAKNPWLILVPCHRVVAQKGLGGFALGLSKKQWLLDHEKS